MGEHSDFISSERFLPSQIGEMVSIFVCYDHPLLKLKRTLVWEQLEEVMVRHRLPKAECRCWLELHIGKSLASARFPLRGAKILAGVGLF